MGKRRNHDTGFEAHVATREMDAAVMVSDTRACGAVAGICGPRHPVLAARAVMERTEHVLLTGAGVAAFLRSTGLEMMPANWLGAPARREALEAELERRRLDPPDDGDPARSTEPWVPSPAMLKGNWRRRPPRAG